MTDRPRTSLSVWLRAARPLAHANIAPPIALGMAFAYALRGEFSVRMAAVALVFGVLNHLAIVFTNDFADRHTDAMASTRTLFSGGSRVIPDGLVGAPALRNAAIAASALLLLASALAGWAWDRPHLWLFAGIALALSAVYSLPPARLSHRGFGEVLQGVGVGLLLPLLGWYVQTGRLIGAPLDAFAPLFLIAFASNILTAIPDCAADTASNKRSWPVRRGEARSRRDALVFVALGVALVSLVGPRFDSTWSAFVIGPPAFAALMALAWMKRPGSSLPFVTLAAGAGTLLHLTWTLALVLAHPRARGA